MDGLKNNFEGRVDVFDLDWDDPALDSLRSEFDISGRSQYLLIGPDGEVIRRWFGPLNSTLNVEVDAILIENGY